MIEDVRAVQAILAEIQQAMIALASEDKTHMIYLGSTGLTEEQQVEVLETLGKGDVTISFTETIQPVEWYETNFRGVWVGTYKNQRDEASLYTIEVTHYPNVAGSYNEDIIASAEELKEWVEAASI